MFRNGDLVRCEEGRYVITTNVILCEVVNDSPLKVRIVGHPATVDVNPSKSYNVDIGLISSSIEEYKEYMTGIGYAVEDLVFEVDTINNNITDAEPEGIRGAVSDDIINKIGYQYYDLASMLEYNAKEEYCIETVRECVNAKSKIISWLRTSPYWDEENLRLVVPATFHRDFDANAISNFRDYMLLRVKDVIEDFKINGVTHRELCYKIELLEELVKYWSCIRTRHSKLFGDTPEIRVDGYNENMYRQVLRKYRSTESEFSNKNLFVIYDRLDNRKKITEEEYEKLYRLDSYLYSLLNNPATFITAEQANGLNEYFDINAVEGQKNTRVVLKIAKLYGITTGDTYTDVRVDAETGETVVREKETWEREYDKFCSAISPKDFKQTFYMSVNPMDFLTSSFGNGWTSCYSIDKHQILGLRGQYGNGCCSGGTLSYALDPSTITTYTLENDELCCEYDKARKINRCNFAITPNQIVQSRMYPQSTDGDAFKYQQFREIAQEILSDCWGITNQYKTKTLSSAFDDIDSSDLFDFSEFVGYNDFLNFSNNARISLHKEDGKFKKIKIGSTVICPCCGEGHEYSDAIACYDCYSDRRMVTCYSCGERIQEDDAHYYEGDYYCHDCVSYCEYHEEYEYEDMTFVEGYGSVCEYALESGAFFQCEECGEWSCDDDYAIHTEDGRTFCCEDCASDAGYARVQGDWHEISECTYCDECGEFVLNEDFNDELNMCNWCAERHAQEQA